MYRTVLVRYRVVDNIFHKISGGKAEMITNADKITQLSYGTSTVRTRREQMGKILLNNFGRGWKCKN